jgi:hypothetical protein
MNIGDHEQGNIYYFDILPTQCHWYHFHQNRGNIILKAVHWKGETYCFLQYSQQSQLRQHHGCRYPRINNN